MKYALSVAILMLLTLQSFAETISSRIQAIDPGKKGEADLLFLETGHTAFLKPFTKALIPKLNLSQLFEFEIDGDRNVVSIAPATDTKVEISDPGLSKKLSPYEPSIVSPVEALAAFSNMSRNYRRRSQCYNRAHVWSYEEFKRTGMKTGKLFLFFTSKYIREYRYEWWFHVTPIAYVGGVDQSNWRTLDRLFNKEPLGLKTWTDQFMSNKVTCPVVSKYSDYNNNQESKYCYLIPASMYYWQPLDLDNFERTGFEKTDFDTWEINRAYGQAF